MGKTIYKLLRDLEIGMARALRTFIEILDKKDVSLDDDDVLDLFAPLKAAFGDISAKKLTESVTKKKTGNAIFKSEFSAKMKADDDFAETIRADLVERKVCTEDDFKEKKDGGISVPVGKMSKYTAVLWKELGEEGQMEYHQRAVDYNKQSLELWMKEVVDGEDVSSEREKLEGKLKIKRKVSGELTPDEPDTINTALSNLVEKNKAVKYGKHVYIVVSGNDENEELEYSLQTRDGKKDIEKAKKLVKTLNKGSLIDYEYGDDSDDEAGEEEEEEDV